LPPAQFLKGGGSIPTRGLHDLLEGLVIRWIAGQKVRIERSVSVDQSQLKDHDESIKHRYSPSKILGTGILVPSDEVPRERAGQGGPNPTDPPSTVFGKEGIAIFEECMPETIRSEVDSDSVMRGDLFLTILASVVITIVAYRFIVHEWKLLPSHY